MMLDFQTVTASPTMAEVFPPLPPLGPSPVLENSKPSASTPFNSMEQPLAVSSLFPETCKAGGAARVSELRKKAGSNTGRTRDRPLIKNVFREDAKKKSWKGLDKPGMTKSLFKPFLGIVISRIFIKPLLAPTKSGIREFYYF